jgi:ADP-ribose pyrophosphatase YjhB (NUDIX family)
MTYLPDELYARIERSMPIACVDFVPVLVRSDGLRQVGLILRESPHGRVWCHLGGRVQFGETIRHAIGRHARETLQVEVLLEANPQPSYVYEWFPSDVAPTDGTVFGDDPRKHAIGLSFVVEVDSNPIAQNEALEFAYFSPGNLPALLWPGCEDLLRKLNLV